MRVIFMRHGESTNNILSKENKQLYQQNRTVDPELSPQGIKQTTAFALKLKKLGITIDAIYSGPQKRALHSAQLLREHYGKEELPVYLQVSAHEKGGCYLDGKGYPGMSKEEVLQLVPGIIVDDKNSLLINENGWWKNELKENNEECTLRIKECIKDYKEIYKINA